MTVTASAAIPDGRDGPSQAGRRERRSGGSCRPQSGSILLQGFRLGSPSPPRSNRSKSDQDPVDWTPPLADARCTYAADWVATKLRRQLTADDRERPALTERAAGCGQQMVDYQPAP
ncbi:hypothetical protein GCM10010372_83450 [Streptomyces tauricus]|nr:hypothetical protein GCM10010372_83450 [Streptomyces tauricus]